ncbi:MAG: hypothetical protein CVV16_11550 [Gammaproteobacteria bacterium HGW-Gammaproteobacteria-6]|nr:MAG: hypothetical protein CVV16_11550 [Gammaproteobacteria bacterium HGW-Gammaproteobacteria-6]
MIQIRHVRVLVWLSCVVSGSALAHAKPVSVYAGTIGNEPVELVLIHDHQRNAISGHLFDQNTGRYLSLEETPHQEGDNLLINLMTNPRMPGAALLLPGMRSAQGNLDGQHIDLQNRHAQALKLKRVGYFPTDVRESYDGVLLQPYADTDFVFRVHARRASGVHGGQVSRIDVTRRDGTQVQVLEDLDFVFFGSETLHFADFDGDGIIDFRVTPRMRRQSDNALVSGNFRYYLYRHDQGGYRRHTALEALGAQGPLRVAPNGVISLRPDKGVDYRAGTIEWRHYRFTTADTLELERTSQENF